MPSRALVLALALLALVAAGCGRDSGDSGESGDLSGKVTADGSSTVGPFVTAAAEQFKQEEGGVDISVGISGTGGGFDRFCRGETDLSDASRPIEPDEQAACKKGGVDFVELHVANDGIVNVVSKQNTWISCITTAQLKTIWDAGSKVDSWNDVDPKFPDEAITLAGPGTDSGTFDFFTKEINGEGGQSRSDYQATEDDNVVVEAVAGDKGGLGYFGLSYYEQNQSRLEALEVDGGGGCVAPTKDTVQSGTYKPLSRPLFVYVKRDSLDREEVRSFLEFMLDNESQIAGDLFVPLTSEQQKTAKDALANA